ncbi:MAG: Pr2TM family membrane protein [Oscillatoriales cyanobacterium SM2_1_8]|nr:Pr2TM family membrane protein [Oscillatoriales cyanobacterium SM2_1_8]
MEPETYSDQEVQEILQRALARRAQGSDRLSRERVQEIAAELGVSEAEYCQAEQEWQRQRGENQLAQTFATQKRRRFRDGLVRFAIVNAFLMSLDFWGHHRLSWSVYPLLGWGLGMALDAWVTFNPQNPTYQKQFTAWKEQYERERAIATATETATKTALKLAGKFANKLDKWIDTRP